MRPSASVSPSDELVAAVELDAHAARRAARAGVEDVCGDQRRENLCAWTAVLGGDLVLVGVRRAGRRGRPPCPRRRAGRAGAGPRGRARRRDRRRPRTRAQSVRQTAKSAHLPGSSEPRSSRPSTSAPPRVPSRSASRAVIASGPPRAARDEQRLLDLVEKVAALVRRRAVDAEPDAAPASSISATGAMPAPRRMFEVGQCATPVPAAPMRPTSSSGGGRSGRTTRRPRASRAARGTRPAGSRRAPGSTPPPRRSRRDACAAAARAAARARPTRASAASSPRTASRARPRPGPSARVRARAAATSRSVSARISSRSSTSSSGGRPPSDSPRSIEPREATIRTPSSRAAWISASISPGCPCGKT